ncbi:flagellin lysine-N-methylase [Caenispirillum bisanense]|uniref:flagellin lysine-N-methylase n=1 Tax=Caenispirillum bisanense TaxID=414052 RepID=UPI0031CF1932
MAGWTKPNVTMPRYMARFSCIGGACEASCCSANWNISVTDRDYRKMRDKAPPSLKDDIKTAVRRTKRPDGTEAMLLKDITDPSCVLLADDGGCRLHAAVGPGALPPVCYTYPREALIIDNEVTVFADLSCPEAVRLALFDPDAMVPEPAEFDPLTVNRCPSVKINSDGAEHHQVFEAIRGFCDSVLLRRDLPFWQRVAVIGMMFDLFRRSGINRPGIDALEVVSALATRLNDGTVAAQLQGVTGNPINQLQALMPLVERWLTSNFLGLKRAAKGHSVELVRELGYALKMETGGQATVDAYVQAYESHFAPYAARNPHVIENLFRVPFTMHGLHALMHHGFDRLWEDGLVFALTRMLLIAQAGRRGAEFGDADVVPVVMAMWRRVQHDNKFREEIRDAFQAAGCVSVMHLCALLAPVGTVDGQHTIY